MGFVHFLKYVGDKAFQSIKHLWFVRNELDKEKRKFEADMETGVKTVARGVGNGIINYSLPKKGLDKKQVLQHMIEQSRVEDGKWEGGKLSGVRENMPITCAARVCIVAYCESVCHFRASTMVTRSTLSSLTKHSTCTAWLTSCIWTSGRAASSTSQRLSA